MARPFPAFQSWEEMENGGNGRRPLRVGSTELIEIIGFILLTFKPCYIQSYIWKE